MKITAAEALSISKQYKELSNQPGIRDYEALSMLGVQSGTQLHTFITCQDIQDIYVTLSDSILDKLQVAFA